MVVRARIRPSVLSRLCLYRIFCFRAIIHTSQLPWHSGVAFIYHSCVAVMYCIHSLFMRRTYFSFMRRTHFSFMCHIHPLFIYQLDFTYTFAASCLSFHVSATQPGTSLTSLFSWHVSRRAHSTMFRRSLFMRRTHLSLMHRILPLSMYHILGLMLTSLFPLLFMYQVEYLAPR